MNSSPVAIGILDVVADPEYRKVLAAALQEIRDNIAKLGRDAALVQAGDMNYTLSLIRPDIIATMATIVMFELAEKDTDTPAQQG